MRERHAASAVELVAVDRGAAPVALLAVVARGPHRDVEAAIGSEGDGPRPVAAPGREVRDDDRRAAADPAGGRIVVEAQHPPGLGDVELAVEEREAVGEVEALHDRQDRVGPAVPIVVGEREDAARARHRDQERATRVQRHEAREPEVAREELDREAGREPDGREVRGRRRLGQDTDAACQRQPRTARPAGAAEPPAGGSDDRASSELAHVLPIRDATRTAGADRHL